MFDSVAFDATAFDTEGAAPVVEVLAPVYRGGGERYRPTRWYTFNKYNPEEITDEEALIAWLMINQD